MKYLFFVSQTTPQRNSVLCTVMLKLKASKLRVRYFNFCTLYRHFLFSLVNSDFNSELDVESGSSHTFTGDNDFFTITKFKHNEISKTRLVSEASTSVNSDFYPDERQK